MNKLEKKLGIWNVDKITREDGKAHAEDYCCVRCYEKSEQIPGDVFWPMVDPDIPHFPYCKGCADEEQIKLMIQIYES